MFVCVLPGFLVFSRHFQDPTKITPTSRFQPLAILGVLRRLQCNGRSHVYFIVFKYIHAYRVFDICISIHYICISIHYISIHPYIFVYPFSSVGLALRCMFGLRTKCLIYPQGKCVAVSLSHQILPVICVKMWPHLFFLRQNGSDIEMGQLTIVDFQPQVPFDLVADTWLWVVVKNTLW